MGPEITMEVWVRPKKTVIKSSTIMVVEEGSGLGNRERMRIEISEVGRPRVGMMMLQG
jgi:hypothetical protein